MDCRRRLLALIATIILPIAGWAATTNVTVGPGLAFNPASVTIAPGDTVQWTWTGAFHSSTSNATSGPEFWDSGVMSTGTYSHTFSTVGDWPYYCLLHSSPTGTAMNGVVHVVAAAATPTLTGVNPTSGPPAGGTVVTLTGTNFASGCTASFGTTTAASTTVSDSTTIFATTPAHAAGVVDVSVACPGGNATLPAVFTFATAPAPVAAAGGPMLSSRGLLILAAALAMAGAFAVRTQGM